MATNDDSLINQFFDLQALVNQQNEILQKNSEFAKKMKENFTEALSKQDIGGLQSISKELDKVTKTTARAKTQLTDFEKAQRNLEKQIAQNATGTEKLNEVLNIEANSLNELQAKSKLLESVRKNMNIADNDYEKNQRRIIASQDEINKKLKEYQTAENQRLSGIGKYKQAIEEALRGEGNFRQQLREVRNTMAGLLIEIDSATKAYGANSKEVRELQEEYNKLEQKAADVTDAQGDMQARINYLADDYGKFKAVVSGVQAAMGAVAVFKGFTNLLGIQSERVERVTAKMASMLAVMKGLQEVQALLNKDNYFMQFIRHSPAINRALTSTTGLFNRLKISIQSFGLYVAGFVVVITALIKILRSLRDVKMTEFERSLEKATDRTEKLTIATEYLNKQYGKFELTLGGVYEKALKIAKTFDDIIAKMVQMAIIEASEVKMQEMVQATMDFAIYKNEVLKTIEDLQKELRKHESTYWEQREEFIGQFSTPELEKSFKMRYNERTNNLKKAINDQSTAIKLKYQEVKELQKDYERIMGINAEEVANIMQDLLRDYSSTIEQLAVKAKETVKTITEEAVEKVDVFSFSVKKVQIAIQDLTSSKMQDALNRFNTEFTDFNKVLRELEEERLINLNIQIEKFRQKLYEGEITLEEYNNELLKLTSKSVKEGILNQIGYLEALASTATGENLEKINKQLRELRKNLSDITFEEFITEEQVESIVEKFEKIVNSVKEIGETVASSISEVFSQLIVNEQEALRRADVNYLQSYEARKSYIENNIADETMRAEALQAIEVERLDHIAIMQQKEAELQERKARFDNALTIIQTQLKLAAAIADAIAAATPGDPYTLAVRIAAAAAAAISAGAAVYAAIAQAGSIPSYAQGGEAKANIPFRAGEEGEEIGFGQNTGQVYKFNRDAIYKVNENVKILTARESKQISSQTINNNKEVNLRNVVYVKVIDNQRVKKYFKNI